MIINKDKTKYIQLIPILVVDAITIAWFGLIQASPEQLRVIPLALTLCLFGILCIASIACLLLCSKNRLSSALLISLSGVRIVQLSFAIAQQSVIILAPIEYTLMISLLVIIPAEYFTKERVRYLPYTAHFSNKKAYAGEFPHEGDSYIKEQPEVPPPDIHILAPSPSLPSIGGDDEKDPTINPFKILVKTFSNRKFSNKALGKKPQPGSPTSTDSLQSPPTSVDSVDSPSPSAPSSPSPSAPPSPRRPFTAPEVPPSNSSDKAVRPKSVATIMVPRLLPVVEKLCFMVVTLCCAVEWIIGLKLQFVGEPITATVDLVLAAFIWCALAIGIALICVQLVKVQRSTLMGIFFGTNHTHGLVTILVIGGVAIRIAYDFFSLLVAKISVVDYISNKEGSAFMFCGRHMVTQLLPFGFHCFNILAEKRHVASNGVCNTGSRMRWIYHLLVLSLQWMLVGHAFYVVKPDRSSSTSILGVFSRASAYAASVDFCFIVMALVSPIAFTFYQFCNFGAVRKSIHKIHIHRSMVVSGLLFALLHILLHAISWGTVQTQQFNHTNVVHTFKEDSSAFVSGVIMTLSFAAAGACGYAATIINSSLIWRALHIPMAGLGLIFFFGHGHQNASIAPIGSYMVLVTTCVCTIIYVLFFLINPPKRMLVDMEESDWADTLYKGFENYIILVLTHGNRFLTAPGAFFTLYVPHSSSLSYVHGHPFPVFSNRNGKLYFLIKCRKGNFLDHASFTQQLLMQRPQFLYIQGPFFGSASAFIQSLTCLDAPAHVYLCGWSSGFANVYALLEHFKVHSKSYAIKSVNCVFSKAANPAVNEAMDSFINELVSEWESTVPLSIIESKERKLEHIWIMGSKQVLGLNKKDLANVWRENFSNCNRWVAVKEQTKEIRATDQEIVIPAERDRSMSVGGSPKVLYFCGQGFNHSEFLEGWQVHVETVP